MKTIKIVVLLCVGSLIILASCQPTIDLDKEKEAIMALIQKESETARDGDVDGLMSCYIQDEFQTRLGINSEGYKLTTGWDDLKPLFESSGERGEMDNSQVSVKKENPVIKIMGNSAWLICDNTWEGEWDGEYFKNESIQVTFLEKVKDEWKFSFTAWITKPQADDEGHEDGDEDDGDEDNE